MRTVTLYLEDGEVWATDRDGDAYAVRQMVDELHLLMDQVRFGYVPRALFDDSFVKTPEEIRGEAFGWILTDLDSSEYPKLVVDREELAKDPVDIGSFLVGFDIGGLEVAG